MANAAPLDRQHGNNFDAIRMMAALTVLYSHHFALTSQAEPSFLGLYSWGGAAVIVFFVISGYLVTSSWYNDPNVLRFSLRRFLRIWPALTVVVICTAYVLGAYVTTLPLHTYWTHGATAAYLRTLAMQVHFVLPGVFEENPYARGVNGSLWTIPLEVRCYVVMALAGLLSVMRVRFMWLCFVALYAIWFLSKTSADVSGTVHYGSELSAFFLAGSALFLLQAHWERRPVAWILAASIGAALTWSAGWHYTAVLIVLPLVLVYVGTRATPVLRRAGRWGDPSYGTYLIAFPVQQTVILFGWPHLGFVGTLAISTGIVLVLAYASWHGIEKQALKVKPRKR